VINSHASKRERRLWHGLWNDLQRLAENFIHRRKKPLWAAFFETESRLKGEIRSGKRSLSA